MATTQRMEQIPAEWWTGEGNDLERGERVDLKVEHDENDLGRVAIHTMRDGTGSHASYYLDREAAIVFARNILDTVALG